jgi:hypothetical protein
MRLPTILALMLAGSGCAQSPEYSSLGYGDYVALNCERLGQEAVRLMREVSDRSEHMLQNDQSRREKARQQLGLIKQASAEKGCT